jgi:hypothetical protein
MKQDIVNNSYKLKIVEKNVNTISVNLKKTEIVEKEISNLDSQTKVYDRCGRMYLHFNFYSYNSFVLTQKENIVDKLKENSRKLASDLESQKDLFKKLQESITEQTKHYNELAKNLQNK